MNQQLRDAETDDDRIDFGEMAGSLGLLLRLAQVKVFDSFFESLSQHGLKPGEFTMLWVIGLNPDARQGVIARRLRIKPAHMTKLVQRNVDKGLVERVVPDDDRRAVHLRLTKKGLSFLDEKKPEFLNFMARENTHLTDDEFRMLIGILQKFNEMGPEK